MNKNVISIAPFDTNGTTHLLADLKTFHQFRSYGTGVATELISANSTGVQGVFPVPFAFVAQQLESITSDIEVHGVKVGTLRSAESVKLIASLIDAYKFRTLVVDASFRSRTGDEHVPPEAIRALVEHLLPRATVLVVNAAEAAFLTAKPIGDVASMKEAAQEISKLGPISVVVTGGHLEPRCTDVVWDGAKANTIDGPRIATKNTLGAGAVFSAALLALIVRGTTTGEAVSNAKKFVAKSMQHPFVIGRGDRLPLNLNTQV